jgi:hypothetical protein
MWGSWVLSKLTLLDMVRLETALLNCEYGSGLLRSYRVLPPIHFPLTNSVVNRELCWKWLFSRGFISKIIVLDDEYFQFPPLKMLLVKNADALSEGLKTPGFNHCSLLTFLHTTPSALLDKVRYFSLSSCETPAQPTPELPNVRLPFHQLRSFEWHSPGIDHQCLISALEDNSMLERLRVYVDIPLPVAFFPALFLRGSTLTSLSLEASDLTDADMHAIGQHCRSLTDLELSGRPATNVSNAGISAVAEGCVQLRKVRIRHFPLTGDSLAALFTHCVYLRSVCCQRVPMSDAAIVAMCDPARVAAVEELDCSWAVSSQLNAAFYQHAFSALKAFQLFDSVAADCISSLCSALRAMRLLQRLSILMIDHHEPMPATVLDAVALGTSVLKYLSIGVCLQCTGDAESALVNIARRNPQLRKAKLIGEPGLVTGAVLHALAENCANFSEIGTFDASMVTDASLCALASGCPRLSSVALPNCAVITDRSILALAAHCPLLMTLNVKDSTRITHSALQLLLRSCQKLVRLEVSGACISEGAAVRLRRLMPREHAHISRTQGPGNGWVAGTVASVRQTLSRCWAAVATIGHPAAAHP